MLNSVILLSVSALGTISSKVAAAEENFPKDTTYYHLYLAVERGVTEELIKTYPINKQLAANISVIQYQEFSYQNQPSFRNYSDSIIIKELILTSKKIDTLNAFKNMVMNNSIRHNQGIKIAGRYGTYSVISHGDTIKTESRNLFSLVDAMQLLRK